MTRTILILLLLIAVTESFAGTIQGTIKEKKDGAIIPFASVLIKGTTNGTTANSKGQYQLNLEPGNYILLCQHVGHKSVEKKITVTKASQTIDFELEDQQYDLKEVVVNTKGEDPAYAIIRNAIKKRTDYENELDKFQCNVYIKGQLQLRDYPKKFLGQKVDFEDGDTSKRKMIFLSETIARYTRDGDNKRKTEVLSTRVSGQSDGFGFSSPQIISFYENNVALGRGLNPRGFVSPIANGALNFYKYKFEGTFFENGREINRIKVIPKRKYEPLFSGYINIMEGDWRIHSTKLMILKEQQMQFLDTLTIEQLYVPAGNNWVIKNQVIYPAGKFFTFDFFGSFVQIYDQFDLSPKLKPDFFDATVLKFVDSSNKRPKAYWDSIRPVPLLELEAKDYKKKDSLELVQKDPKYLDSLDRKANKVSLTGILLTGESFIKRKRKESFSLPPILDWVNYNVVEGWVFNAAPSWDKRFTENGREELTIQPTIRYGTGNRHWNGYLRLNYNFGKKYFKNINVAAGSRVFQFNNANPILPRFNTLATLSRAENFMKLYEAGFATAAYSTGLGKGASFFTNAQFQDRRPLENLANPISWRKGKPDNFTPNYPVDLPGATQITRHQALSITAGITWQPGARYVEFPERKVNVGSRYPTFNLSLTQGIPNVLGSDVQYTKWRFGISDNINMNLGGRLNYRVQMGGFLNKSKVFLPDYQHIAGNQTIFSSDFLNRFQLAPYYRFSNTASFYTQAHVEYHLNGLLTNKIPLFKKLNWFFVTGANSFLTADKQYNEVFFSVENIFKIIRVDFMQGFESGGNKYSGVRLSFSGLLAGSNE